jgi:hypothetical protein
MGDGLLVPQIGYSYFIVCVKSSIDLQEEARMDDLKSSTLWTRYRSAAILLLLCLLAEALGLTPLIWARIENSQLTKYGIRTQAEVFDPGYYQEIMYLFVSLESLPYRFSALDPKSGQMRTFQDKQFVSPDTTFRLEAGDPVDIMYLPSNPNVSRLTGNDSDDTDLEDALLYLAVFGPPGVLILWEGIGWVKNWIDRQNKMP